MELWILLLACSPPSLNLISTAILNLVFTFSRHFLRPVVLSGRLFCPMWWGVGHSAMSADIFGCHKRGANGIWWVKAKDAAEHPTMHRTAPITKNYPAQNVNHAEVEKSCLHVLSLYT